MRSKWSGSVDGAFFSADKFDKHRILLQAEEEYSGRTKNGYYVIGVDVGRLDCTTEATVIKVTPQPQGAALKSLVNLFSLAAEDFEEQAIHLKKLYYRYKAKVLSIDANGLKLAPYISKYKKTLLIAGSLSNIICKVISSQVFLLLLVRLKVQRLSERSTLQAVGNGKGEHSI